MFPSEYPEKAIFLITFDDVFLGGSSGLMHKDCIVYSGGHGADTHFEELLELGHPMEV